MIGFLILGVIVAMVISFFVGIFRGWEDDGPIGAFFYSLGFPFFIAVFGGVVLGASFGLIALANQEVEEHRVELRAISNKSSIQGSFNGNIFVSSGRIDEVSIYQFYGKNPDGSFTMGSVRADESRVIEDEEDNPYAVCERNVTDAWDWLGIDSGEYNIVSQVDRCTLHVPAGSMGSGVDISELDR